MRALNNGIKLRWLNTAGFEIVMGNGKHILLDPFISGQVDGLTVWPISLDEIQGCNYLLLSHIHVDHAKDVGDIKKKFPQTYLFCPDLAADPLCQVQDLDCAQLFPVRGGDKFQFDDVTIEVFYGRHTESPRGYRPSGKSFRNPDGSPDRMMWFGNLQLVNYLITTADGTRILVWAGMTSPDQKRELAGLYPDIALMHISPKQDFSEFAALVKAIGPKLIIPHHYDLTEQLLEAVPAILKDMSEENQRNFVENGHFNFKKYMTALEAACRTKNPGVSLFMPEHHKWYRVGMGIEG